MKKLVYGTVFLAVLSACGGGGGGDSDDNGATAALVASSSVANQCVAPRPAGTINPDTGKPYGDKAGSLTAEKAWIRAYVNETYLWYKDVAYVDPSKYVIGATVPYREPSDNSSSTSALATNFDVVDSYFNSQRSTETTASGKPKDQYHYTYLTSDYNAQQSAGSSLGFGFQIALLESRPPRSAVVAYSDPNTPASEQLITRGAHILEVNGVKVADGDPTVLNEGMFSPLANKTYTFKLQDQGSATTRTISMTPRIVTSTPVQNVRTLPAPYADVGYLQFNEHIATAEGQLIGAINQLKAANNGAGIKDLVLDVRYNGGGYLDVAAELAYMIAGPSTTAGKTFEKLTFNDKNPYRSTDADTVTPFLGTSKYPAGQSLPSLGLSRVYMLVGSGTCSASESIINGLKGIGIDVILIGNTTCGKPYGFLPQDNCSVTYFSVNFRGVNHAGFGDYADGFIPGGTGSTANNLPGCAVADDFSKPLGDVSEARLAAALRFRTNGTCGPMPLAAAGPMSTIALPPDASLGRSFIRENRILRAR